MISGRLRHRARIEKLTGTVNSFGEEEQSWELHKSVYCSIEPVTGRENFTADQRNLQISHKITLRYQEGITGKMRVCFKNRYYNIESILNHRQINKYLILLCTEDNI